MTSLPQLDFDGLGIGFVVSLRTLREVLHSLSVGGRSWWIACDPTEAFETRRLTIGHGDPGCIDRLNTLYFDIPILNDEVPISGTDSLALLLDSSAISAMEPGFYMEGGRISQDPFADLECFFQPIREVLINMLRQE